MARWLVVGAAGMLGTDLVAVLRDRGHEVTGADLPEVDILDPRSCAAAVAGHDVVVNCAAYTAVDAAEDDEATAFAVNAAGAATLARAVAAEGASLVQVSTDYVVAGDGAEPWPADAAVAPASAYGRTKAAGEWAVRAECPRSWVVRTAWLYGAHGPSIPATVARLAADRETFGFVADQVGQPTWTVDLAEGIARVVEAGAPFGIWHGTNAGETSWHGLARAVLEEIGADPDRVQPVTTEEFPRPAPRPSYSVLAHDMWAAHGLDPLPDWRDALHRAAPVLFGDRATAG
ncbi:dTDP-4-dehydrorhamnose reductase [Phycicoccus sp. BSK3Z-2]|uniref:dTDP-4-dehydrorhamnose reductase n=1 Tax=Phycicoccus avicenniae TaxID=2828860 RepID=A0A941D8L0_9MICO|nr:dTDP-4-dehydrorhamnose reductase [Phycicoccus avicenniae]MBR7743770.1 dTDP-4-dehydrorhamnose reductase [Phycicoccus avicenniae]